MISMCVYGHHAGLPDCLNRTGASPYLAYFTPEKKRDIHYDEAVQNYFAEVATREELDGLFSRACTEVKAASSRLDRGEYTHQMGMLTRMVLSAVVDADRWNSACFEHGADSFAKTEPVPDWGELSGRLEAYLARTFTEKSILGDIRGQISQSCLACAGLPPGVYTLTVPTGGGKTFATLRFALKHAEEAGMRRIFYIIPFNTILDQNAADIREALGEYEGILEHHSGVVQDEKEKENKKAEEVEDEEAEYRLLTERWDSPIILTSMVQFLNALYRKENTDARRMRALSHAVLIFDEVQALPKKCTRLFERAIRFLVRFLGCTVVLCTATQPQLDLPAQEMIPDVKGLFDAMQRVEYEDQSRSPFTNEEAAERLIGLLETHGSVLAVVNTKEAAQEIYEIVKKRLKGRSMPAGEVACFHLSTNMCPEHRLAILKKVKERTQEGTRQPTFLISTALIEAGINVSFPAVVRSLAGLSSIIQAAGRCNRNWEDPMGTVYLWNLKEEKLGSLPDIQKGQKISNSFLEHYESAPNRIGDPDVIDRYFRDERKAFEQVLPYPYIDQQWTTDLCELLSQNEKCKKAALEAKTDTISRLAFPQSFRTAGEAFRVIDENTRAVLVPYGEGAEIIKSLLGKHSMKEEIQLIRRAQRFSISLYDSDYRKLASKKALDAIGETGIVALKEAFYDLNIGRTTEPSEMEYLISE